MFDGKKEKSRVIVGGESSRRVDGSGSAPDVGMFLDDQFPPDPPFVHDAVISSGVARRRVDDEGTEADDESQMISLGGLLSIVGGCESEGVTFEETVRSAGLIPETETALDTAGLPIC